LSTLAECDTAVPLATRDYQTAGDVNPVSRQRIETVHRYVRDNLDGDISQAEIAAKLGLSSPAFSRFFRGASGTTFVSFVNTLRVDRACRMLQSPSVSITEIAMSCGYHNMSNFNRQFLAIRNMNPSEYRQRFQMRERRPLPKLRAVT
jgi:transcriptional regulator GlxA family with amidase domain